MCRTWKKILAGLQTRADAAGLITWEVSGLHHFSGASARGGCAEKGDLQAEPPGGVEVEPADHALGRSRGGFSTKTHLASEQGQKPLSLLVTAGQRGDSPQFEAVLDGICVARVGPGRPCTTPDRVLGDKAYSSRGNRGHAVECCINRLKRN